MIRKAAINDLDGILSIVQSVGTRYKDPAQGFLMNDYTQKEEQYRDKYGNILDSCFYTYVYEDHEKIKAFLIAHTKDEWFSENPCWAKEIYWYPKFDTGLLDKFILINQTAMYPELTGKGIGSLLYESLIKDLKAAEIQNIFAETIIAPIPNLASLNFRIKQKYEIAGVRYEENNGTVYTTLVYYKPVSLHENVIPFTPIHSKPSARKEHAG